MVDWAEEKAREIVDGCTERRKMTLPSGREADVVVAIHPTADKIAAALREADKRAREECRAIAERQARQMLVLNNLDETRTALRIATDIRSTIKEAEG